MNLKILIMSLIELSIVAKIAVESYQYQPQYHSHPVVRPYVYKSKHHGNFHPSAHARYVAQPHPYAAEPDSKSDDPDNPSPVLDLVNQYVKGYDSENSQDNDAKALGPELTWPDVSPNQNQQSDLLNFDDRLQHILHNRQGIKRSIDWVLEIIDNITIGLINNVPLEFRIFFLDILEKALSVVSPDANGKTSLISSVGGRLFELNPFFGGFRDREENGTIDLLKIAKDLLLGGPYALLGTTIDILKSIYKTLCQSKLFDDFLKEWGLQSARDSLCNTIRGFLPKDRKRLFGI